MNGRCKATNRQGKRCGKWPIPGGKVCRLHGGGAPQVIRKAEEHLRELRPQAVRRLEHWLNQDEFPSVSISAVKDVLDRNGELGKAREHFDVNVTTAQARVARLVAARKRGNIEQK